MFYARAPSRGMGGWQGGHRTHGTIFILFNGAQQYSARSNGARQAWSYVS